jgi:subtilisin family serine protease
MNKHFLYGRLLLITAILISCRTLSQPIKFGFDQLLLEKKEQLTTFCVPNDSATMSLLKKDRIIPKYSTKSWVFISCTPRWINEKIKDGELADFYFDFSPPVALSDSAVVRFHADQVHKGGGGLSIPYTGKDVIVGVVDQGLDWSHPDFKDSKGKTRVLRYWDHTTDLGGTVPSPYNYGIVWDSAAINAGICTSTENSSAHGTTVAGMAVGNGRANGTNKGFAPEADIIIVETDFNRKNWTLSIADACDYIFKVADSLGKPAVINLSLGSYLGSHDGNDPASEHIENLLTEKPGRIVVSAAGNSGAWGKYHVHGELDSDTSFVWMRPNPSARLGPNTIYMDLWADSLEANWKYALGANRSSGSYGERASTIFRSANTFVGNVIRDTLWNGSNRIAIVEIYPEYQDQNLHIQFFFSKVDTTNYYYSLKLTGSGSFDAWTGSTHPSMKLNDMVTSIPSSSQYPPIVNYLMPDSLQTIVSSWNCSEKVISVGNVKNRIGHMDKNGNWYDGFGDQIAVGQLSRNSSKGPNRHNLIKPDVTAAGDVTLGSAPMWMVNNTAYNSSLDINGWHARNGGTSMASPCVAGIAALYLEKCGRASYTNFRNDLINTSQPDQFTGSIPNNAYGYGKPHALNLMLTNEFTSTLTGNSGMCATPIPLTATSSTLLSTAFWSNDSVGTSVYIDAPGDYWAEVYNNKGCKTLSDTFTVVQLEGLPMMPITQMGNTLITSSFSNYQWTIDGIDIPGATSSILKIYPPFGTYTCYSVSPEGCVSETEPFTPFSGLNELNGEFKIFPNPTIDILTITGISPILKIEFIDAAGRVVYPGKIDDHHWSLKSLSRGLYKLVIETSNEKYRSKIIRL